MNTFKFWLLGYAVIIVLGDALLGKSVVNFVKSVKKGGQDGEESKIQSSAKGSDRKNSEDAAGIQDRKIS